MDLRNQSRVFIHGPEWRDGHELGHEAAVTLPFGDHTVST